MIKRLAGMLWFVFVHGSVATVLTLAILLGYLALTAGLSGERLFHVAAALYGIDLAAIEEERSPAVDGPDREDVAFEEVLRERALRSLDRDLREQAIAKGLADLRHLQQDLIEERRRYDLLKNSFDAELAKLQNVAKNDAIIEVQRTLEAIQPKQAKDHLLRMLPERFVAGEFTSMQGSDRKAVIDVVTIVKAMPLDKRKKILAEFKTEQESESLAEILRLVRLGVPEVELIGDTRNRLQEFKPN